MYNSNKKCPSNTKSRSYSFDGQRLVCPLEGSTWLTSTVPTMHWTMFFCIALLLFPVDRDTHEFFCHLQSNVFDAASLFQTNHVVHWNAPREDTFFCVASWHFRITWCSFTTCLSSRGKLTALFIVSNASKKPLWICPDHILSSAVKTVATLTVLWQTKSTVSFLLEDKHVVNEHHVMRKSHDATQKNMSSRGAFQCTTWLVWNKLAASKTLLWRR